MRVEFLGNNEASKVFIQMSEERDLAFIEEEMKGKSFDDFCMTVVIVDSWNKDLSPWSASGVFGEDFGDGADETLNWVIENVVKKDAGREYYLTGYSLAGLFSLYAAFKTDVFAGVAAVSPSVWFPGFAAFVKENEVRTKRVYLSLGDKEHKIRNSEMAKVKDCIEEVHKCLKERGVSCTLEYNPGNHFKDVPERMAKGISWLLG